VRCWKIAVVHSEAWRRYGPGGACGHVWRARAGFENVAVILLWSYDDVKVSSPSYWLGNSRTDITNEKMLIQKVDLDIGEGANMVIIKPALRKSGSCQECQGKASDYSVGGLPRQRRICNDKATKSATAFGWEGFDLETLDSIKKARADIMLTYFAVDIAKLLSKQDHSHS